MGKNDNKAGRARTAAAALMILPSILILVAFLPFFAPPVIHSVSVEPQKVRLGDTMLVTAHVSGAGTVAADMGPGIETIKLDFVGDGLWRAEWKVHSTGPRDYTTTIKATNLFGLSSYFEAGWSDPVQYTWTTNSDWQTGTFANTTTTSGGGDIGFNWTFGPYFAWQYRKPISISGSASNLTDFQVNVTPHIYNETGLVGSWHFSESSGNATADSSGQGNTGYQYGTNRTTDGRFGNAMRFDGVDDYIEVPNNTNLRISGELTLSAWIKVPDTNSDNVIVSKGSVVSAKPEYGMWVRGADRKIRTQIRGNQFDSDNSTVNLEDDSWHYVSVTFSNSQNTIQIYIDGVLNNQTTAATSDSVNSYQPLQIGRYGYGADPPSAYSGYFNGTIDEVRIYNRTLSASEIQQHYQASKARLDYADVRFTDSNDTALPFWMESDGKFWVKVPSIPTTGTTIYAYYGNPQATDAQNGAGTFELFDDFNDGSDSLWTNNAGTWTENTGVRKQTSTASSAKKYSYKTLTGLSEYIVGARFYVPSSFGTSGRGGVLLDEDATYSNGAEYDFTNPTTQVNTFQDNNAHGTAVSTGITLSAGNWYNMEGYRGSSNTQKARIWRPGSPRPDWQATGTFTSRANTRVGLYGGLDNEIWFDDFYVRKYASPEPSAVNGTEEARPTRGAYTSGATSLPAPAATITAVWNDTVNWRYRVPVNVTNPGSVLTDYQVNVSLDSIYNSSGLVGSWHFSESSGNATADSSGQGNTGYQYGTNRTTDGKFGNAMSFDGVDDYISIPDSTNWAFGGNDFTIDTWIKFNNIANTYYHVYNQQQSGSDEIIYWWQSGVNNLTFRVNSGGSTIINHAVSWTPLVGVWYHVVLTRNSNNFTTYVNGVQQGFSTIDTDSVPNYAATLTLGGYGPGTYSFNGTIDEVRIYNRTLSASEIAAHYQAGKARLDLADVRFTDSAGIPLPFWLETDGKAWVKVPSVPAGSSTIYMYYGNPFATDAQNGTGTFLNNADVGFDSSMGWTTTGSVVTTIADSKMSYAYNAQRGGIYSDIGYDLSGDFIYDFVWSRTQPSGNYAVIIGIFNYSDLNQPWAYGNHLYFHDGAGNDFGFYVAVNGVGQSEVVAPPANGRYYGTIKRIGNTAYGNLYSDAARTISVYSKSYDVTGQGGLRYAFAVKHYAGEAVTVSNSYVDSAFVRKYASSEPFASVVSSSETVGPYPPVGRNDPNVTVEVSANNGTTWHAAANNTAVSVTGDSTPLTSLRFRASFTVNATVVTAQPAPRMSDIALYFTRSWWDTSWKYRSALNVTSAYAANYAPVWANVSANGHVTNCTREIRVTGPDNETELPSWITPNYGNGAPNYCSVFFHANLTAGSQAFYVYYGNSTAAAPNYPQYSNLWSANLTLGNVSFQSDDYSLNLGSLIDYGKLGGTNFTIFNSSQYLNFTNYFYLNANNYNITTGSLSFTLPFGANYSLFYGTINGLKNITELNWNFSSFNLTAFLGNLTLNFSLPGIDGMDFGIRDWADGGSWWLDENGNSLDSGLVGEWHFEEGAPSTALNDSSGYGNHGNYRGSSLLFDGQNDFVNISNLGNFGAVGTIEVWFKLNSTSGGSKYIVSLGASDPNIFLRYNPTDGLRWAYFSSGTYQADYTQTLPDTSSWHQMAYIFETNSVKAYLDGILVNTDTSATISNFVSNADFIGIGAAAYAPFSGNMDEVRIYNRTLSPLEIREHYQGIINNETGIVSLWRMKEGSGQTIADDSGNGKTATLGNTTSVEATDPAWSTDAAPLWTTGKYGSGLNFNGADKYVNVSNPNLPYTNKLTISYWAKNLASCSEATYRNLLDKRNSGNNQGFVIQSNPGGSGSCNFGHYLKTDAGFPGLNYNYGNNQWTFVTLTYNSGDFRLYANGAQTASTTSGSTLIASSNDLILGTYSGVADGTFFNGTLDEVKIWNRALSPGEVKRLYELSSLRLANDFLSVRTDGNAINITNSTGSPLFSQFLPSYTMDGLPLRTTYRANESSVYFWDWTNQSWKVWQNGVSNSTNGMPDWTLPQNRQEFKWQQRLSRQFYPSINITYLMTAADPFVRTFVDAAGKYGELSTSEANDAALVGYWKLNSVNQTNYTLDSSRYGNDGKLYNYGCTPAVCNVTNGKIGPAISFDGVDDYVNISSVNVSGSSSLTIDAWINLNGYASTSQSSIVIDRSSTDNDYQLVVSPNDNQPHKLVMSIWNNLGVSVSAWSSSNISLNSWTHVAGTYDGSKIRVFINGMEDGSATQTGVINVFSKVVQIGSSVYATPQFNGTIDEVRIWNRTLSADEIRENYYRGGAAHNITLSVKLEQPKNLVQFKGGANVPNLTDSGNYTSLNSSQTTGSPLLLDGKAAGIWHFDEGSGTTAFDSSGNGNNGLLKNGTGSCGGTACPSWTIGKFGNALQFDGIGDFVNASTVSIPRGDYAFSLWMKAGRSDFPALVRSNEGGGTFRGVYLDSGKIRFYNPDGMGSYVWLYSNSFVNDSNWHFVTATVAGTIASIYIDGVLDANSTLPNPPVSITQGVTMGKSFDGNPTYYLNGTIDEVRIYPRALTPGEIREQYQSRVAEKSNPMTSFYDGSPSEQVLFTTQNRISQTARQKIENSSIYSPKFDKFSYEYDFDYSKNQNFLYSLGYASPIATSTGNPSSWPAGFSNETLESVAASTLTYYSLDDPSLVGWWKFNEGFGNSTADSSGWGNTGALNANVSWFTNGCKAGSCLNFNGSAAKVDIPDSSSLNLSESVTLSAWINPKSGSDCFNSNRCMVIGRFPPNLHYMLYIDAGYATMRTTIGGSNKMAQDTANLMADAWSHLTGVYDGTKVRIYVNGVEKASVAATGPMNKAGGGVRMGYWNPPSDAEFFNGTIDNVKIYSRALSADEIKADYLAASDSYPNWAKTDGGSGNVTTTVPQSWQYDGGAAGIWSFDEGSGSNATDSSGNGNTGNLNNFGYNSSSGWTAGKYGSGLMFDGADDYVQTGNYSTNTNGAFTVEAWAYAVATSNNYNSIVSYAKLGNEHFTLMSGVPTQIDRWSVYMLPSGYSYGSTHQTNQWYHLVLVYDGTYASLYVNGVADIRQKVATYNSTNIPITIGRWYSDLNDFYFNGTIDEVRIYPRALSASEVKEHYQRQVSKYHDDFGTGIKRYFGVEGSTTPAQPPTPNGTVLHLRFNEGTGNSTRDYSGFNNTGYLYNGDGSPAAGNRNVTWANSSVNPNFGNSLYFNGTTGYVNVGKNQVLNFSLNDFTVGFWAKAGSGGASYVFAKGGYDNPTAGYSSIYRPSQGSYEIDLSDGVSYFGNIRTRTGLNDSLWHHIAFTVSRTSYAIAYADGAAGTPLDISNRSGNSIANNLNLVIGARENLQDFFNGTIDEVLVVNRSLSASEIRDLYLGGYTRIVGSRSHRIVSGDDMPTIGYNLTDRDDRDQLEGDQRKLALQVSVLSPPTVRSLGEESIGFAQTYSSPTQDTSSITIGSQVRWNVTVVWESGFTSGTCNYTSLPADRVANSETVRNVTIGRNMTFSVAGNYVTWTCYFNETSQYTLQFNTSAPTMVETGWAQNATANSTAVLQYINETANITNPSSMNYSNVLWSVSCPSGFGCPSSSGTISSLYAYSSSLQYLQGSGDAITESQTSWAQNQTRNSTVTTQYVNTTVTLANNGTIGFSSVYYGGILACPTGFSCSGYPQYSWLVPTSGNTTLFETWGDTITESQTSWAQNNTRNSTVTTQYVNTTVTLSNNGTIYFTNLYFAPLACPTGFSCQGYPQYSWSVNFPVYPAWAYREPITINNTGNPANLTNYQVLVNLTNAAGASNYLNFSKVAGNGTDVRFTWLNSSTGREQGVPFWIETWNSSGGNAKIWVKLPYAEPLSGNSTLYLYYGNPSVSSSASSWNDTMESTPVEFWNYTQNPSSGSDYAYSVAVDSSGNVYAAGYDDAPGGTDYQWRAIKLNSNGNELWNYTQNPSASDDIAYSVAVDSSGNVYAAGYDYALGNRQWRIIKLGPNGNELWNYTQNPSGSDVANAVAVDSSGNVYAAGYDYALGNRQWRIIKLGPNGNELWNYTQNPSSGSDVAQSVAVDSSGNVYAAGYDSVFVNYQWRIVKLGPNGNELWNYTQKPSSGSDVANAVAVDSSGNVYVAGNDDAPGGADYQWRVIKLDTNGNSIWNYTQNPNTYADSAYSIAVDSLGSVYAAGYLLSNPPWRVIKLDTNGNSIWNYTQSPQSSGVAYASSVAVDSSGNVYAAGNDNALGNSRWRIIRLGQRKYSSIEPNSIAGSEQATTINATLFETWGDTITESQTSWARNQTRNVTASPQYINTTVALPNNGTIGFSSVYYGGILTCPTGFSCSGYPQYSWLVPTGGNTTLYEANGNFNVTADLNGTSTYYGTQVLLSGHVQITSQSSTLNHTNANVSIYLDNSFLANSTTDLFGNYNRSLPVMPVGAHYVFINATGPWGVYSWNSTSFAVQKATGPTVTLYVNSAKDSDSAITYGAQTNVTATAPSSETLRIYRNGTLMTSGSGTSITYLETIAGGYYNFTAVAETTQNFTATSNTRFQTVSAADNKLHVYLNGNIDSNLTVIEGTQTNATANSERGLSTTLYINSTPTVSNPYVTVLLAGSYNYTAYQAGNENYTANSTTARFLAVNNIPPALTNATLSSWYPIANQNLTVSANATDYAGVSAVWASLNFPNGTQLNSSMSLAVNSIYLANFIPPVGGNYSLYVYANDTYGAMNSTLAGNFTAIGKTAAAAFQTPQSVTTTSVNQSHPYQFAISMSLNSTGNATATYNMTPVLPAGFYSNSSLEQCTLQPGQNCTRSFMINVTISSNPYSNTIYGNVSWTNPDLTVNYTTNSTDVYVISNPELYIAETLLNTTAGHGSSLTYVSNFTIQSIGNINLASVNWNNSGGGLSSAWITYSRTSQNYPIILKGDSKLVHAYVTVPLGQDPGTYAGNVTVNATGTGCSPPERCWANFTLRVVVPTSGTWSRSPSAYSAQIPIFTVSNFSVVVNNTGNINLTFSVSPTGNTSILTSPPTSVSVAKQNSQSVLFNIDTFQVAGNYTVNITFSNSSATPASYTTTAYIEIRDVPPNIDNPSVSKSTLDINYESIQFKAKVTDNVEVTQVWVNISKPDGNYTVLNMTEDLLNITWFYANYVPTALVGGYSAVIHARDDASLTNQTYALNFTTIGATKVSANSSAAQATVTGVTKTQGGSLQVNVTLNNFGSGSARYVNLSWQSLPSGWSAGNLTYGTIPASSSGLNSTAISIPANASNQSYAITALATWMNADNTTNQNATTLNITVAPTPVLDIVESSVGLTVPHERSNATSVTLNSSGNVAVSGITMVCQSGETCANFTVSFSPSSISGLSTNASVNVSVAVPAGYPPGTYTGTINASGTAYDTVQLEVTVPANLTWDRTPANLTVALVGMSQQGTIGSVAVYNRGNQDLLLNVSLSGNSSGQITVNASLLRVGRQSFNVTAAGYNSSSTAGFYEAVVSIANSTATPTGQNVTVWLRIRNFTFYIQSPKTASPALRVRSGDSIEARAVAYDEGILLTGNLTWQAALNGTSCPVTNYSYAGGGYWAVNCTAPVVADALNYTLQLTANYTAYGVISSAQEGSAVSYADITYPRAATNATAASLTQNVTVEANVTENFAVDAAILELTNLNGTKTNYTMSRIGNTPVYRQVFVNLTEIGDYNYAVYANDTEGNMNVTSSWFEVYTPLAFNGTVRDRSDSPVNVSFAFRRPNTSYTMHNFTNSPSSGAYNQTIHKRSYDAELSVLNNTLTLYGTAFSNDTFNSLSFDNVAGSYVGLNPEGYQAAKAMYISSNLTFSNATIVLNYGSSQSAESMMGMYRCSSWDRSSMACNSTWSRLTSAVDTVAHSVSAGGLTSFSAYAAAKFVCGNGNCESQYGESNSVCSQDCPISSPTNAPGGSTGGGGGGGGGGGAAPAATPASYLTLENITNLTRGLQSLPFNVLSTLIDVTLRPGESQVVLFGVVNNLDEEVTAELAAEGKAWEFVSFEDQSIKVKPKSTEYTQLKISAPKTAVEGTYSGDVSVVSNGRKQRVPLVVRIEFEKEKLLDLKVEPLAGKIDIGQPLKIRVEVYNLGMTKRVDVFVTYNVKSLETDETVTYTTESFALETSLSFVRVIKLPQDMTPGKYVIEALAEYDKKKATGVSMFEIMPPPFFISAMSALLANRMTYVALALAIALVAGVSLYRRMEKERKARQKYVFPLDFTKLPKPGPRSVYVGQVAESDVDAYVNLDDLTTHMVAAGGTGGGKSVSAMVLAEEALKKKVPVIVFDPTAQWTGFIRPCKDRRMLALYPQFKMKPTDARAFKGSVIDVMGPEIKLDIKKYVKEGEITVFNLSKLTPTELNIFVKKTVNSIFEVPWDESKELKLLIVYDEVHRLLPKYSVVEGTPLEKFAVEGGYLSLERGCREFRKWGIGLVMISQVLMDFRGAIRTNIGTELQMRTKYDGDIRRAVEKYGAPYADTLSRLQIGTGLMQNPEYNEGRPWFIRFRPLMHDTSRISEAELSALRTFAEKLQQASEKIAGFKGAGLDTYDVEIEMSLAEEKMKQGLVRMAEAYVKSIGEKVAVLEKRMAEKK